MPAPPFSPARFAVLPGEDAVWVDVAGEIDFVAAPQLHRAIDAALQHDTACWIDLTAVGFLDSSCVHALLHAQRQAAARGTCLFILPPEAAGGMLAFELLGLTARLPFVEGAPSQRRRRHLHALPSLSGAAATGDRRSRRDGATGRPEAAFGPR